MRRGSPVNQSSQPSLCAQRFAEGVFFGGKGTSSGFTPSRNGRWGISSAAASGISPLASVGAYIAFEKAISNGMSQPGSMQAR